MQGVQVICCGKRTGGGQSHVRRRTGSQTKKLCLDRVWVGVSLMPRPLSFVLKENDAFNQSNKMTSYEVFKKSNTLRYILTNAYLGFKNQMG